MIARSAPSWVGLSIFLFNDQSPTTATPITPSWNGKGNDEVKGYFKLGELGVPRRRRWRVGCEVVMVAMVVVVVLAVVVWGSLVVLMGELVRKIEGLKEGLKEGGGVTSWITEEPPPATSLPMVCIGIHQCRAVLTGIFAMWVELEVEVEVESGPRAKGPMGVEMKWA